MNYSFFQVWCEGIKKLKWLHIAGRLPISAVQGQGNTFGYFEQSLGCSLHVAFFPIISSQKRYDGPCAPRSLFPSTLQPLSCGIAPAHHTTRLPSTPRQTQPTNPAQAAETPYRPCRSCPTATTTCPKRSTHCLCPPPHPMAAAPRHGRHITRVALWGQRLALHASSSTCLAPS